MARIYCSICDWHYHSFTWCWGLNPGLCVPSVCTLPTKLCPQSTMCTLHPPCKPTDSHCQIYFTKERIGNAKIAAPCAWPAVGSSGLKLTSSPCCFLTFPLLDPVPRASLSVPEPFLKQRRNHLRNGWFERYILIMY